MTRQWRSEYEGAFYHVMSRGDEGNHILSCEEDKQFFIELLGKGAERYQAVVYAYCIMDNHYHLLLETLQANLSRLMHFIGTAYANRLSHRGWIGHVFSSRYKSICAERDESLLPLSRYIHRNPLEAGMVRKLEDYRWSSYRCYLGIEEGPPWLDYGTVMKQLGTNLDTARWMYRQAVLSDWEGFPDYTETELWAGSVLGSRSFLSQVIARTSMKGSLDQVTGRALLARPLDLERLCGGTCAYYGLASLKEAGSNRGKESRRPRRMFIYLAKKHTSALNREIAELAGDLGPSGVTKQYMRIMEWLLEDSEEANLWEEEEKAILSIVKP